MTESPSTSTLLILPARPLGGDTAAITDIAEAAGLAPLDVRMKVATGRAGVLLRSGERSRLEEAASRLRTLGHSAAVIGDADVKNLPPPVAVRGITTDGSLDFVDEKGRVRASIPAGGPILVAVAHLDRTQPARMPMNPGLQAAPDRELVTTEVQRELRWLTEIDRTGLVIDVAWNGGKDRVRLRGERLAFATLGRKAAPSAAINIRAMLARLLSPEFHPTLDLEFEQFQPPRVVASGSNGSRHAAAPGAHLDRMTGDRDSAWDSYVRFLIQAWSAGLFEDAGMVVTLPEARARLTRVALVGPALVTNAADEPAGTPRAERAVLVADPVSLPSIGRRLADRMAHVGPVGVVGALALSTAAAITGHLVTGRSHPWYELAAMSGGLLGLTHALTLLARYRRIDNIPTSRIRSAAVGPCEIHGHARAASPLRTPFSQMPCVWFECRMVRRELESDGIRVGAPGFTFQVSGDKPRERVQVMTSHSNNAPFYIEDDTGRIEVDPTGAQFDISTVQTMSQVPFAAAPLPPGTRVEITERYIPVDQPIWVMGQLQALGEVRDRRTDLAELLRAIKNDPMRMAAGDENGDGIVDALEWQTMTDEIRNEWELSRLAGTGRTDRLVLGRPRNDGFFYITERSEKIVVRRFLWRAAFWLAIGAGLLTWALLSLRPQA